MYCARVPFTMAEKQKTVKATRLSLEAVRRAASPAGWRPHSFSSGEQRTALRLRRARFIALVGSVYRASPAAEAWLARHTTPAAKAKAPAPTLLRLEAMRLAASPDGWRFASVSPTGRKVLERLFAAGLVSSLSGVAHRATDAGRAWLAKHTTPAAKPDLMTRTKTRLREGSASICDACGKPAGYYALTPEMWRAAAHEDDTFLCIPCVETRLGRLVERADFNQDARINGAVFWALDRLETAQSGLVETVLLEPCNRCGFSYDMHHGPESRCGLTPSDTATLRQLYLGVLGLLARCSIMLKDSLDESADEMRDLIVEALTDAQKVVPSLRWKRVLSHIEVEVIG